MSAGTLLHGTPLLKRLSKPNRPNGPRTTTSGKKIQTHTYIHTYIHTRKGSGISGSPPLAEIFRKQAEQASQQKSPGDSTSGTSQTTQQAPPALQEKSKKPRLQHQKPEEQQEPNLKGQGPTPRRLHFPTELDQQAQGTLAHKPAQAKTPSSPDPSNRDQSTSQASRKQQAHLQQTRHQAKQSTVQMKKKSSLSWWTSFEWPADPTEAPVLEDPPQEHKTHNL